MQKVASTALSSRKSDKGGRQSSFLASRHFPRRETGEAYRGGGQQDRDWNKRHRLGVEGGEDVLERSVLDQRQ